MRIIWDNMSKSSGLVILNGRKTGDVFGKLTSFQWNGSSVADYVIVSQSIYDNIEYFKVFFSLRVILLGKIVINYRDWRGSGIK